MLVQHEGMLAADKGNLLLNKGSLVVRQRRMHVPDNGVLILSKEIFLASKLDYVGQCSWYLPHTKQSFHQTRGASSCHTIYSAWARQRNAGPEQEHLVDSLGQS